MSVTLDRASLPVGNALADAVAHHGTNETGRILFTSGANISRWGSDLTRWPAETFLAFAKQDKSLSDAVVAYVRNEQTTRQHGEAIAAMSALLEDMGRNGRLTALEAKIIADGQVNARDRQTFAALEAEVAEAAVKREEMMANLRAKIFPEARP